LDDKPAEKEDEKEAEKEAAKPSEEKKEGDKAATTAGSETKDETAPQPVDKFTEWKNKWPASWTRDAIDKAAVEFCAFNNKANRKKLVKAMFTVHRSKLDWLPYFSRLTATLNQYWKDVGPNLVSLVSSICY
jgi:regulator of nonsense transcripts 2